MCGSNSTVVRACNRLAIYAGKNRWRTLVVGVATLALVGCVTLTPEEQEWRRHIDQVNWDLCQQVYEQTNVQLANSSHLHGRNVKHHPWMVKEDLSRNSCKMVLRGYWAHY